MSTISNLASFSGHLYIYQYKTHIFDSTQNPPYQLTPDTKFYLKNELHTNKIQLLLKVTLHRRIGRPLAKRGKMNSFKRRENRERANYRICVSKHNNDRTCRQQWDRKIRMRLESSIISMASIRMFAHECSNPRTFAHFSIWATRKNRRVQNDRSVCGWTMNVRIRKRSIAISVTNYPIVWFFFWVFFGTFKSLSMGSGRN